MRKHVKITRALLRSGYPMYTLNFYKQLPIGLLLQKEWNVSDEVISKVVKAHIDSGFDVLQKPVDMSRKVHHSFWIALFKSGGANAKIL